VDGLTLRYIGGIPAPPQSRLSPATIQQLYPDSMGYTLLYLAEKRRWTEEVARALREYIKERGIQDRPNFVLDEFREWNRISDTDMRYPNLGI
jgi:hypothetical protein